MRTTKATTLQLLLNNRVSNQYENRGFDLGFFEKNDDRMRLEFFKISTIFVAIIHLLSIVLDSAVLMMLQSFYIYYISL